MLCVNKKNVKKLHKMQLSLHNNVLLYIFVK